MGSSSASIQPSRRRDYCKCSFEAISYTSWWFEPMWCTYPCHNLCPMALKPQPKCWYGKTWSPCEEHLTIILLPNFNRKFEKEPPKAWGQLSLRWWINIVQLFKYYIVVIKFAQGNLRKEWEVWTKGQMQIYLSMLLHPKQEKKYGTRIWACTMQIVCREAIKITWLTLHKNWQSK